MVKNNDSQSAWEEITQIFMLNTKIQEHIKNFKNVSFYVFLKYAVFRKTYL